MQSNVKEKIHFIMVQTAINHILSQTIKIKLVLNSMRINEMYLLWANRIHGEYNIILNYCKPCTQYQWLKNLTILVYLSFKLIFAQGLICQLSWVIAKMKAGVFGYVTICLVLIRCINATQFQFVFGMVGHITPPDTENCIVKGQSRITKFAYQLMVKRWFDCI